MERRNFPRYQVWFPVKVDAGDPQEGYAVGHDASQQSLRMVAPGRLEVGEAVTVTFRMPAHAPNEHRAHGRVIRVEPNDADPEGPLRYRIVVQFDAPLPELEPLLQAASE